MLWLRRIHTGFFSCGPLNYETLSQRVAKSTSLPEFSRHHVLDYIQANRTLQKMNDESPKLSESDFSRLQRQAQFLELDVVVSNQKLQDDLWTFLQSHWELCVEDREIVSTFVSGFGDEETSRAFDIVNAHFAKTSHIPSQVDPVGILFRKLLQRSDYHNCIGLLDSTYNSKKFRSLQKRILQNRLAQCALWVAGLTAVQTLLIPSAALSLLVPFNAFSIFGTFYGLLRTSCLSTGDRVTWRSYTSAPYRFVHRHEQNIVNMVIAHFEEHSELNVKNFHTSEVRSQPSLGIYRQSEYEIILPTVVKTSESHLPAPLRTPQHVPDEHVESLSRYFREELQKRKLNWEPIKEEERFLDFWLTHGENYEWVEPDQDPAEISKFRSHPSP